MIEHIWTLLCSQAIIDRDSNNLSLFNVIEQINIEGEPQLGRVAPVGLEVVSLWVRSDLNTPGRGHARLTFVSPTGTRIKSVEDELDLTKCERLRTRRLFAGLELSEPGQYTFKLELLNDGENRWREVASVPLKVVFAPTQTAEPKPVEQE